MNLNPNEGSAMYTMKRALAVACIILLVSVMSATVQAAVDLAYFEGSWDEPGGRVTLRWGTASELDNAGFHVWRSESPLPIINGRLDTTAAGVERLTTAVISSDAACTVQGHDYEFVDSDVAGDDTFYYYLQSFHCQSNGHEFKGDGLSGLRVTRLTLLYLPTVLR